MSTARFYKVIHVPTGAVLASRVRIANTMRTRAIGLLNRKDMDAQEGLLISPCDSIHTFFMKFAIDVAFLNRKNKIVKIVSDIRPGRMAGCLFGAQTALELSAGILKKTAVKVGDPVEFIPVEKPA